MQRLHLGESTTTFAIWEQYAAGFGSRDPLNFYRRFIQGRRVLDVGSGKGGFTASLVVAGLEASVVSIDENWGPELEAASRQAITQFVMDSMLKPKWLDFKRRQTGVEIADSAFAAYVKGVCCCRTDDLGVFGDGGFQTVMDHNSFSTHVDPGGQLDNYVGPAESEFYCASIREILRVMATGGAFFIYDGCGYGPGSKKEVLLVNTGLDLYSGGVSLERQPGGTFSRIQRSELTELVPFWLRPLNAGKYMTVVDGVVIKK